MAGEPDHALEAAYAHCTAIARGHYENFPVASRLLPARLRRPVEVIYAFARTADDIADEGDLSPAERIGRLDAYGQRLTAISTGERPAEPLFIALADVMGKYALPAGLFHDLLSAFRQDVVKKRYAGFGELLDYCRRSADPVGRLLLHLNEAATEENLRLSDRICSALQLINFLQDIEQDYRENDRIYLPRDEMLACGVTDTHLRERIADESMRRLMTIQIERAREMMLSGAPLGRRLKGRFGLELRAIIEGGLRVVERLAALEDPFARPRLGKGDFALIIFRAIVRNRGKG